MMKKMPKAKWTSERGIGIEEVKKPIPKKQPSWLDRLLQLIKGGKKMIAFIIAFIISAGMVIGIAWWLTDGFKF